MAILTRNVLPPFVFPCRRVLIPVYQQALAHHILSHPRDSSLIERRVCALAYGHLHDLWRMSSGLLACDDGTRSYGFVHRSVPGRRTRERHRLGKIVINSFSPAGSGEWVGSVGGSDRRRRRRGSGHNPGYHIVFGCARGGVCFLA